MLPKFAICYQAVGMVAIFYYRCTLYYLCKLLVLYYRPDPAKHYALDLLQLTADNAINHTPAINHNVDNVITYLGTHAA